MNKFLSLLLIPVFCFAVISNWNGVGDTAVMYIQGATEIEYTSAFPLTDYINSRLVVGANDTGSAGFASDSVYFVWGYQTGCEVVNGSGTRDTVWDNALVVLDSLHMTNFGSCDTAHIDSLAVLRRGLRNVDTLNVSGYATQSRYFAPQWDELIRFFAKAYTGNKVGNAVKVKFQYIRSIYSGVRAK